MRSNGKRIIWAIAACLLVCFALLALVACGNDTDTYADRVKVIFELEGGTYKNSEEPVTYYYPFAPGSQNLISELGELSGELVERKGYKLEGWYATRTVNADGSVTYSDKWDFDTLRVGDGGVTLYAKWLRHTFDVCYRDENGDVQVIGSYIVDVGETFDDYRNFASKRTGYTSLGVYRDADGNVIDDTFTHPGGEGTVSVQVFPDYVEGNYAIIRTANDLIKNKSANLYLMNDIDMEGKEFGGFGAYKGIIEGNGHSIRNFVLTYAKDKSAMVSDPDLGGNNLLCIGLFQSLNGATLRNVTFADFSVTIGTGYKSTRQILFAPLCVKLSDSTLENVKVSVEYEVGELPKDFNTADNLILVTDKAYCFAPDGDASQLGVDVTVTQKAMEQD